jgi:hypothetical protein
MIRLKDKIDTNKQQSETEANEDKTPSSLEIKNNKFINNQLQSFIKNNNNNNNNDSYTLKYNNHNQKYNKRKYDLRINNINAISLEINKYKKNKLIDNRKGQTINIKNKNNFLNENYIKNALKDKNQEKQNNLNINDRRGNNDQLDFFQKFIINKNKMESTEKSQSKKNIEINCNLVLTKKKKKTKKIPNKKKKKKN